MTRQRIRNDWQKRLWTVVILIGAGMIMACSGGGGGGGGSAPPPPPGTTQTLTVDKNGSGTVSSSNPQGVINCGATCAAAVTQGSQVTLTAVPSPGSTFSGWGNVCPGTNPCTVTLSNDLTVPANFSGSQNFNLTVNKSGTGTVTSNPAGIQCGAGCSTQTVAFSPNTQVTLTASQGTFLGWGGPCSGTAACVLTLNGDAVVQANFTSTAAFDFSLAATPNSQAVFAGAEVSFTVTATLLTPPASAVPVNLDVQSGCPANATCTFMPNPVTPTAISTLVVTTNANTPIGPTSLVIRGIGGSVTRTTTVQLNVVQTGPSSAFPRFAYVANSDDDTLSIFTVSANPGQLRHRGYVKTGITPVSVATDPLSKFVYVANHDVGTISGYVITQPPSPEAGNLTPSGSAVASGKLTNAVAVHPTLNVLYAVNFATTTTISNGSVSAFTFNSATGALTQIAGSPFLAGRSSTGIAIDPAGKFAYVANYPSNPLQQPPISAYDINPATGALTPKTLGTLFPNPSAAITIDPVSGRFLFTADDIFDRIAVYRVNASGDLTQVQTVSAAAGPVSLAVDPSGKFLYAANQGADKVSGFAINQATGALTPVPGSPFAAGTGTSSVTVDPSGNFVYATNLSNNSTSIYLLDQGTGALSSLGVTRTRREPAAMAITKGATPVTYAPKFAYTANETDNSLSEFSVNSSTGALAPLGQSVSVTGSPVALTTTLSWKFAYVVRKTAAQLSGFLIDSVTGLLSTTPTPTFGTGASPQDVAIESSGRFLYVVNQDQIWRYQIQSNGNLGAQVLAFNTGTDPVSVTTDPTGQFAYVANRLSNSISPFTIDSGSGDLSQIGVGPVIVGGVAPQSIAADPSGQFLYVVNGGSQTIPPAVQGTVSAFQIKAGSGQDGQLVAIGSPIAAGLAPANVAIDPTGKWVFVTNSGDGTLSEYRINSTTGALTPVGPPIPVGTLPDAVTVDPSGKFAYVTVWGPGPPALPAPVVVAFVLNPGTGVLTPVVPVSNFPVGGQPRSVKVTGTIQ